MKVNVKKLNGNSEPLDIGKILKWGEWACADSPNVSFESILAATEASFYDGVETAEINLAICTQCEIMAMVSAQEEDYQLVEEYTHIARNLYIPTLLKKSNYFQSKYLTSDDILEGGEFKLTDTNIVPLPRYKLKSIIRLGVELDTYDPTLLDGSISDELFEYADSLLDYSYMNNLKFGGMRQFEGKYLRRIDGHLLEDPLQLQLLVALAAVRSDITFHPNCKTIEGQKEALENYYRLNRNVEQNLPTPFLLCFRTNSKTYDSCCFLPGALIDSPLGSIPIEAIEKDFLVYNENGNIVEVNQPTSRQYSGNVYSLNTVLQPTDSWYVTADHKLRVKSGTNKYCWKEAKDILNDDFLYVPYIKENTQEIYPISFLSDSFEVEDNKIFRNKGKPSTPVLNTELKNNPMFYRLLGYFAGDGHTASNRHVYFTLGKAKIYIDDIKNIVRDIFNIDCKVIDNQHLDSTISVKIHSVVIKKLFNDIIGNNSKDKSDYLNFIQSGSKDCLKQFIVGYFRTDGCAFHSGYTLSSTNKNLINILKQCLLKLNYVPSITKRVRVTNYSTDKESVIYSLTLVMPKSDPLVLAINRDTYKITKTTQHRHRIQFITSGCFVPIRSINYKYVDTTVYDFAVDCDTHSFTIDGIAVHNCLVNMGDTNPSIRATQTVIGEATEAGAGLGVNMGRIRSKGTRFKKMGKHQGLLGYLGLSSKNLKANNQESRGGSGTINVPIWTRDFYDLVMLKDVTGVEGENRYRHLDYCFSFSMYLVEKIRKNEKILLASPHTLLPSGKTIYEAFFTNFPEGGYDDSEFIAFCEEKLKDPNIPYVNNENSGTGKAGSFAYTYALDMFLTLCRQMINTGRIYTFNATHVNNHSSFLSPIEMTNLC